MKKAAAIKRYLLALFVLLLLAGILALFRPSDEGSIGHTVTFSDGTTMTLKAVTYGTQHRYVGVSGGWQQRVLSLLPRKLATKFSSPRGTLTTGRPSIAFWFERVGTGLTPRIPQLVLCDATGFGISGFPLGSIQMKKTNSIEGWAFESWPRRDRMFTLRVYEQGKSDPDAKSIGEFTVRNPTTGKHPVWNAPEPPVTAREEDLSVTLFDLTAGAGRGFKWKPAPNPTVSQTRAGFRIERDGRPTKEWEVVSVEASDATGNVMDCFRGSSREPDSEYVGLQPHLWPAEQAWKLRVGFTQRSNFLASEIWTLHGMPLSAAAPAIAVAIQTNLPGAEVQYTGRGRRSGLAGNHHFNFRVTPGRLDYRMTLVKAVDDKGQEARLGGSFESPREWEYGVHVNTNATSLNLTVALHQNRYFEFLVRPRVIATNETAPR